MFHGASTPEAMMAEVRAAKEVRDRRLNTRRERLRRLGGPYAYKGESTAHEPENRLFEYIAYVLPRTIFKNPRIRYRSRRGGSASAFARSMASGHNRLIVEQQHAKVLRQLGMDYLLDYCVALISPEPREGMSAGGRPVWWPQMYAVDPEHYFEDPLATAEGDLRFRGHDVLWDKDDLEAAARANPDEWRLENVLALTAEAGTEQYYKDRRNVPGRQQVVVTEVFVPEDHGDPSEDPDDGFSGQIFTMGLCSAAGGDGESWEAKSLRPPRPFYGPRRGPYYTCAFMRHSEAPLGLSPTLPAEAQIRDLAATSRANLRAAHRYKRVPVVDSADKAAIAALKAEDADVIPTAGGEAKVGAVEVGGVTQQGLVHYEMKSDTVDRVLGTQDAQRGIVTGDGTASEVLTAQAASDIRMGDVAHVFRDFVADLESGMGWFLWHDDRVVVSTPEAGVEGMIAPSLRGGPTDGVRYDDLELEVQVYSMEYESEASRVARATRTLEVIGWITQQIMAAPYLRWDELLPELGQLYGIDDLASYVDLEGAQEWANAQLQYQGEVQKSPTMQLGRQAAGRPLGGKIGVGMRPTGGRGGGDRKGPRALPPLQGGHKSSGGGGTQQRPAQGARAG